MLSPRWLTCANFFSELDFQIIIAADGEKSYAVFLYGTQFTESYPEVICFISTLHLPASSADMICRLSLLFDIERDRFLQPDNLSLL